MTTQEKLNDILKFKNKIDKIVDYLVARDQRKLYHLEEKCDVVTSIHTHYKKLTFSVFKKYLHPYSKYQFEGYGIFVDDTISDTAKKEIFTGISNMLVKD